eukprot:UN34465
MIHEDCKNYIESQELKQWQKLKQYLEKVDNIIHMDEIIGLIENQDHKLILESIMMVDDLNEIVNNTSLKKDLIELTKLVYEIVEPYLKHHEKCLEFKIQ